MNSSSDPGRCVGLTTPTTPRQLEKTILVFLAAYDYALKICGNLAFSLARTSSGTSTTLGNSPFSFRLYGWHASIKMRLLKLPGKNIGSRPEDQAFCTMSMSVTGSKRVPIAHRT